MQHKARQCCCPEEGKPGVDDKTFPFLEYFPISNWLKGYFYILEVLVVVFLDLVIWQDWSIIYLSSRDGQ